MTTHTAPTLAHDAAMFRQSVATIENALPGLGSRTMQLFALRVLLASVKGDQPFLDCLEAALRVMDGEAPAPAPTVERVRHPEPADFVRDPVIGHILGEPVCGDNGWCDIEGAETRYQASVKLAGLTLASDGAFLNIDGAESDGCGGIPTWAVGRLLELGQSGAIAELIEMGRRWRAGEFRPVRRLATAAD